MATRTGKQGPIEGMGWSSTRKEMDLCWKDQGSGHKDGIIFLKNELLTLETLSEGVSESESRSIVFDSLRPHGLYSPWNSPGQDTGVGSLFLLKGIFPTQGLNPGLPHCRMILYQLSHKGSPRTMEWVAYPFSSGSSGSRNWSRVSCTAGGFFTNWAIREALKWGKPVTVDTCCMILSICVAEVKFKVE